MPDLIIPKTSPSFVQLAKFIWPTVLSLRYQVNQLKVLEGGAQKLARLKGQRVIICPNHPTAADPDVMFLFSKEMKESFRYLAAREVFRGHHNVYGTLLSLAGCYSVRRGTVDLPSYRAVTHALAREPIKLVMFPEGELSHRFDTLMPLEPGAAQIGFWALEELSKMKSADQSIHILPVAVTYAYLEDPRFHFDFAFGKIEDSLDIRDSSVVALEKRLERISEKLLSTLEGSYKIPSNQSSNAERLASVRHEISTRLATMLGCPVTGNEVEDAHVIRDELDRLRYGPDDMDAYSNKLHHEKRVLAALLTRDFYRLMNLRFFLEKCVGQYAWQEVAEALFLLEMEVLGQTLPSARRCALIAVGDPFDLQEAASDYASDRHAALRSVSDRIRTQIMQMQEVLFGEVSKIEAAGISKDDWARYHRSSP
jgi:1-acyl-sn-glycerol-3-phosphate acyltransferase